MSFTNFKISSNVLEALEKVKITEPSNIQTQSFNAIAEGKNIWLKSPTGSGKTLAYILPLFEKILAEKNPQTQVVMFTPTHELAIQISNFINESFSSIGIKSLALIGKASIERQKEKLKKKPQIVVGSVGRILELIEQKKLKAPSFKYCIIDEADRMLEDDTLATIKKIIEKADNMQYILGSATIKNNALAVAESFIGTVELIDNSTEISTITHSYLMAENNRKTDTIRSLVNAVQPAKSIVFLHRNDDVNFVTKKLSFNELKIASIHGEQDKVQRANTIRKFKSGEINVLVASDVAARGLDIDDIDYVINYDLPTKPEDYQHRAGRTGRMGKAGQSVLVCNGSDMSVVSKIQKKLGIEILEAKLSHGKFRI
jgi:superfamily II DNA/RNA helicase